MYIDYVCILRGRIVSRTHEEFSLDGERIARTRSQVNREVIFNKFLLAREECRLSYPPQDERAHPRPGFLYSPSPLSLSSGFTLFSSFFLILFFFESVLPSIPRLLGSCRRPRKIP